MQTNLSIQSLVLGVIDLRYLFAQTKVNPSDQDGQPTTLKIDIFDHEYPVDSMMAQVLGHQTMEELVFNIQNIDSPKPQMKMEILFSSQTEMVQCLDCISEVMDAIQELFSERVSHNIKAKNEKKDKPKQVYEPLTYGGLLTKQTSFFQIPSISEQAFLNAADSGDVLFFRSNNKIGTWITRTFT